MTCKCDRKFIIVTDPEGLKSAIPIDRIMEIHEMRGHPKVFRGI